MTSQKAGPLRARDDESAFTSEYRILEAVAAHEVSVKKAIELLNGVLAGATMNADGSGEGLARAVAYAERCGAFRSHVEHALHLARAGEKERLVAHLERVLAEDAKARAVMGLE